MNIAELRTSFKGHIIAPGDTEYDKARTAFYGGFDKRPAVIIRVADADDIVKAITLAKTAGLELSVRSGGHSFAGYCISDGGIMIDLRDMKKLEIDTDTKTVWAETGLTAIEVTSALDQHNLAIGFGDTGSVGIGGITLGGGIGFLVRKFGLAIDNLLAAKIVTADGKLLQVDKDNHPDLFWAIRGGGGNFGVVTRFKFQLHDLGDVIGGMLLLPATPEVISGFMEYAEKAPDELSTIINIMPTPPMPFVPAEYHGKLSVMALVMYAGDPKEGEKVIQPLRSLATPIADMIKPMRYKDIFHPSDDSYHPTAVARTLFSKHVDHAVAETIINNLNSLDAPMRVVQLRALGGAASRVANDATAYAHRSQPIMGNVAAFYENPEEMEKRQAWVDNMTNQLSQGDRRGYVGFLGAGNVVQEAYPEATLKKLTEIKKKYDPENLFRLNLNILPS
jgi:hypothetical protein